MVPASDDMTWLYNFASGVGEVKYSACETFKKRELGKQRRRWRMTLRWRQNWTGIDSRLYEVAGLGRSDVEVSCVCVRERGTRVDIRMCVCV